MPNLWPSQRLTCRMIVVPVEARPLLMVRRVGRQARGMPVELRVRLGGLGRVGQRGPVWLVQVDEAYCTRYLWSTYCPNGINNTHKVGRTPV